MKCEHERPISLYETLFAALNNNKQSSSDLPEENSALLVEMPRKQGREQFNDFALVVRGGMHQPFEE